MNRRQLATLLSWAGDQGLEGRKRLQKVIFFLQQAGCPLNCDYILHHFGPYSHDVAETCDEMVAAGLIDECTVEAGGIKKYRYMLPSKTLELLSKSSDPALQPFEELGKRLIEEKMWPLELGSTILYFFEKQGDWDTAMVKACEFKDVNPHDSTSKAALELARRVLQHAA